MGAKVPPRWRYVGQPGAQDGQLGSILGAILAPLGHLGGNFNENGEKAKNFEELKVLKGFWVVWGVHLEPFAGHLGLCWCYLGSSWRYVVPSWRQDATLERQDEPKMAP